VSIYATGADKSYRVRVVLSSNRDVVTKYNLYFQHPIGWYDFGPKGPRGDNRLDLVEIEGIDRGGKKTSIIVPLWVLRHFIEVVDNGELSYELARSLSFVNGKTAAEELKELIRKRRKGGDK